MDIYQIDKIFGYIVFVKNYLYTLCFVICDSTVIHGATLLLTNDTNNSITRTISQDTRTITDLHVSYLQLTIACIIK